MLVSFSSYLTSFLIVDFFLSLKILDSHLKTKSNFGLNFYIINFLLLNYVSCLHVSLYHTTFVNQFLRIYNCKLLNWIDPIKIGFPVFQIVVVAAGMPRLRRRSCAFLCERVGSARQPFENTPSPEFAATSFITHPVERSLSSIRT